MSLRHCLCIIQGNHNYASLMKRFYHTLPIEKRPRVLGLTASPLGKAKANHTDERLNEMLEDLEITLDATIVSSYGINGEEISDNSTSDKSDTGTDDGMNDSISRRQTAIEKVVPFVKNQPMTLLPPLEDFPMHSSRKREFQQLYHVYEELGPLALGLYCQTVAREISRNTFEKESIEEFNSLVDHFLEVSKFCDKLSQKCPWDGRTDKLLALEELLENEIEDGGTENTVGLVFVERRIVSLNRYSAWSDVKNR